MHTHSDSHYSMSKIFGLRKETDKTEKEPHGKKILRKKKNSIPFWDRERNWRIKKKFDASPSDLTFHVSMKRRSYKIRYLLKGGIYWLSSDLILLKRVNNI